MVWVGWNRKAEASRAAAGLKRRTTWTGFSWKVPKERSAVTAQIEAGVGLEGLAGDPGLAHVGQAPEPGLVAPVGPSHQEGSVAVEQAGWGHALPASPSRGLGEIAELDHAAGGDGLAQEREQATVEMRFRPGSRGQPLGVHERFEVGLDPRQRVGAQRGSQLGVQLPERCRTLLEPGALQGLGGSVELCQLLCGEGDETAKRVRAQAPVALRVGAVHELQRAEHCIDGISQAFGRPAADREVGLDVVEGQSSERPLESRR